MTDRPKSKKPNWHEFITALQNLEQEAYALGLIETSHSINKAVQKAGWELAALEEKRMAGK